VPAKLFTLGAVAVCLAVACVAIVSAGRASPHANPPRVAGFDVSVTFFLNYHVEWREKRGVQGGCALWRDDSGSADIFAHNEGSMERPRLKSLQGRYLPSLRSILPPGVPIPPGALPQSWAEMNVLGPAKGSVSRLWIQRGGPATTPCDGQPVTPFVPSPDDCGRSEFRFGGRDGATIRAEYRLDNSALNIVTMPNFQTAAPNLRRAVLAVSVPMFRGLYKKCALSRLAKERIAFMGVPVSADKARDLKNLRVNKSVRVTARMAGVCDDDVERDDPTHEFGFCRYTLRGWIQIRRIQRTP